MQISVNRFGANLVVFIVVETPSTGVVLTATSVTVAAYQVNCVSGAVTLAASVSASAVSAGVWKAVIPAASVDMRNALFTATAVAGGNSHVAMFATGTALGANSPSVVVTPGVDVYP